MEAIVILVLIILGLIVAALIVPFMALSKVNTLERRLDAMQHELRRVRDSVAPSVEPPAQPAQEAPTQAARQEPPSSPSRIPPRTLDRVAHPTEEAERPIVAPPTPPQQPRTSAPMPSMQPVSSARPSAPRHTRTAGEWEALIGGNLFNRIGAIALLIGVAFLLKYGFDHNWITTWMLVGSGFALGVGLMAAGDRFHKGGAKVFAQGLMGTGVSILYLTVYASANMYHLIPQLPALGLMCVVTAAAFMQAVRTDAPIVALLGLAGGFMTPVLLGGGGGGGGSALGLLAYMAVLDAGLLAMALKKDSWVALEPLTLAATYIVYFGWHAESYSPQMLWTVVPFLTVYWLLFYALDVYRSLKSVSTYTDVRMAVAVASSIAFYGAMYGVIYQRYPQIMGLVTILIASTYFVTMLIMARRQVDAMAAIPRYAVTALTLLAVGTWVQFHHQEYVLASLWAIEALALVWCGLRYGMRYVWGCALALFAASLIALLDEGLGAVVPKGSVFVANPRFAAFAVVSAASALAAVLFARSEEGSANVVAACLHYAWCGLVFALIGEEIDDYLPCNAVVQQLATGLGWAVFSLPLVWYGLRKRLMPLAYAGLLVMVAGVVAVAISEVVFGSAKGFVPILNFRAAAFAAVMLCVLAEQFLISRLAGELEWAAWVGGIAQFVLVALGFELISTEIASYIDKLDALAVPTCFGMYLNQARALLLGAAWAIYSVFLVWYGLARKQDVFTACGYNVLLAATVAVAGWGYRYVPYDHFTLVTNLRAAAFAILTLGMLAHYALLAARSGELQWSSRALSVLQVVVGLVVFELITAETWSALSVSDNTGSLRQMGLSVVWVVYSILLMSFGIWRRMMALRFLALALFEITIIKVFLYDLSSLEPLYRIFSFIGLGLFLLATSYLYQRYKSFIFGDAAGRELEG
ncbi:MAG TPA: DUF2339 domain-containing protein [Chloroflexota bacterium]|nr:DUF2339 domain-containing protein [Chloroflexota bacterium]